GLIAVAVRKAIERVSGAEGLLLCLFGCFVIGDGDSVLDEGALLGRGGWRHSDTISDRGSLYSSLLRSRTFNVSTVIGRGDGAPCVLHCLVGRLAICEVVLDRSVRDLLECLGVLLLRRGRQCASKERREIEEKDCKNEGSEFW